MYYMEVLFPELLKKSPFLTLHASKETPWFLVPHYSTCVYHNCVFNIGKEPETCKYETGEYLNGIVSFIRQKYSHWDISNGTNHVFVFSWDQASSVLGWMHPIRKLIQSSVHLTILGSVGSSENFNPHKDIVIPPFANYSLPLRMFKDPSVFETLLFWFPFLNHVIWNENLSTLFQTVKTPQKWYQRKRHVWTYFRGTILSDHRYSYGTRQVLKEIGIKNPSKFSINEGHSSAYWYELGDALFSLCPSGWSSWSPRLFDSMISGSIPVLFADTIRLPFENRIDYSSFLVKISYENVSHVEAILENVYSRNELESNRMKMLKYRRHVVWNENPVPQDALYMTMESLFQKSMRLAIGNREFY